MMEELYLMALFENNFFFTEISHIASRSPHLGIPTQFRIQISSAVSSTRDLGTRLISTRLIEIAV